MLQTLFTQCFVAFFMEFLSMKRMHQAKMHHFLKLLNSCLIVDISMFLAILLYAVVHCLYTGLSQVVHFIGAKYVKSARHCLVILLLFYNHCFLDVF